MYKSYAWYSNVICIVTDIFSFQVSSMWLAVALGEFHCNDVIMDTIASQITSLTIVYSIVYSDTDQRIYQSSASLAFVRGIHRRRVNSPHKWPVTRKMFPFDDVIMFSSDLWCGNMCITLNFLHMYSDQSRYGPNQWETSLHSLTMSLIG